MQTVRRINFGAFFVCCQQDARDPALVQQPFDLESPLKRVFGCQVFFHFACRPGQDMYDGPVNDSEYVTEYTACLIKILCRGKRLSHIPRYLQEKVHKRTLWQQHPEYTSSFTRDCHLWGNPAGARSLPSFSSREVRSPQARTGTSRFFSSSLDQSMFLESQEPGDLSPPLPANMQASRDGGPFSQDAHSEPDGLMPVTPRTPSPHRKDARRKKRFCAVMCGLYLALAIYLCSHASADHTPDLNKKPASRSVVKVVGVSSSILILWQMRGGIGRLRKAADTSNGAQRGGLGRDLQHYARKASIGFGLPLCGRKFIQVQRSDRALSRTNGKLQQARKSLERFMEHLGRAERKLQQAQALQEKQSLSRFRAKCQQRTRKLRDIKAEPQHQAKQKALRQEAILLEEEYEPHEQTRPRPWQRSQLESLVQWVVCMSAALSPVWGLVCWTSGSLFAFAFSLPKLALSLFFEPPQLLYFFALLQPYF